MADFPTRAELFQKGVSVAVQRGQLRPPSQRLTREAIETPGTDINIINAGISFQADAVQRASARRYAALFLDSAEGEDLDRYVADRYSPEVVRKDASPAVTPVLVTRQAPAFAGGVGLDVGTKIRSTSGVEFAITSALGFPANSTAAQVTQQVSGQAQAVQAGLAGNVGAGTLTEFVQPQDETIISVTNTEVAAGGTEVEGDESLRARARAFFRVARRGILGAIEFGATTVGGVASANAIEVTDEAGNPNGRVELVIADSNGQANEVLAQAVRTALLEYRAAGIVVDVIAGVPVFYDITYALDFASNVDTSAVFAQVQQAAVAAVNRLRPRETLQRSLLFAVARSVPGTVVRDGAIVDPAGDVVPTGNEVIRTSTGRVTNT